MVLTGGTVGPLVAGGIAKVPTLKDAHCIITDGLNPATADGWHAALPDPNSLALLQYTSGSTAEPKGVMVTHRNLMHNERMIDAAFGHPHTGWRCGVCWLPLFHDMGLIGGVLQPVFNGAPGIMMSPLIVLQRPIRWLRAISRYRACTSGGPSFAYDVCVQRITPEEKAGLDLSSWSVAFNGAEPIRAETLDRFAEAFAPCGFRREAFYPCYGLAEATLFVTGGAKAGPPEIVAVDAADLERGRVMSTSATTPEPGPWLDAGIRGSARSCESSIPKHTRPCRRGTSVRFGSEAPPSPRDTGAARTRQNIPFGPSCRDTDEGPFLRTGDLGFLQGGELFVTGRIKEMIVVRGRNHYPQDIEATVQAAHPGLRPGGGAAFETTRDGRPRLVVVQEVEFRCRHLDVPRVVGEIKQAVARHHDLQVHDVRLLAFGSVPRTTSGKVQRHLCRAGYEAGTLRLWKERNA